ncbi:SEC-C metal-binding domain-containing protein [Pseudomonas sp. 14P_5.3_Bac1]|uniref:SEC-C metal-binding domain-containing protein n=1 Tax=Pseudomonas sp. 14P_5.3_Bac1 TaxID=2971622 RepID=UPI003965A0F4
MAKIDQDEPCPCGSGQLFKDCHSRNVKRPAAPPIDKIISLKIIPEPDPNTRSIFCRDGDSTVIFEGFLEGTALICGNCSKNLVIGLPKESVQNLVLHCNNCQAFNET